MTLILRTTQSILRQMWKPQIKTLSDPMVDHFHVLPTDIDVYRHMNNAKYLNYMEAVRWGLMARSGFLKLSLKKGWIGPVRSLFIEYYRPLTLGQSFSIQTQFVHFEEKWFYVLHRFFSQEKEVARALVKGTVRKGRTNVPPSEYLTELGLSETDVQIPDDIAEWVGRQMQVSKSENSH